MAAAAMMFVRVGAGVVAERTLQVLAEHRRDGAGRRRANQHQLGPAEQKPGQPSPAFAQIDIPAAGLGERRGQLGDRQRAAQRDQPAKNPNRQHQRRIRYTGRDHRRRAEDARSDRDADDEADRGPEAQTPDELRVGGGVSGELTAIQCSVG